MKRSDFLKKVGLGVVAITVTPEILKTEFDKPSQINGTDLIVSKDGIVFSGESIKKITITPKRLNTEIKVSDEYLDVFCSTWDDGPVFYYTGKL